MEVPRLLTTLNACCNEAKDDMAATLLLLHANAWSVLGAYKVGDAECWSTRASCLCFPFSTPQRCVRFVDFVL